MHLRDLSFAARVSGVSRPNAHLVGSASDEIVVDGLAAVQSRVAAIERRFAPVRPTQEAGPPAGRATTPIPGLDPSLSSFAVAFDSALAATAPSTPARQLEPGAHGRLDPPRELVAFGNGRIPPVALASIGRGDHRLHAPAAVAFQQLETAARAAGITLGVTASYRDLPTQHRLAIEKGLYSSGGVAATPGTSNHGWGLSVDLDLDSRAQQWMIENAWRFGFVEDVPREPWHWTYRPAT